MIAHTKPHVLFSVVLSDLVLVDRCMVWRSVKMGVGVGWNTIQLSESIHLLPLIRSPSFHSNLCKVPFAIDKRCCSKYGSHDGHFSFNASTSQRHLSSNTYQSSNRDSKSIRIARRSHPSLNHVIDQRLPCASRGGYLRKSVPDLLQTVNQRDDHARQQGTTK
jgi:hypothetical protein